MNIHIQYVYCTYSNMHIRPILFSPTCAVVQDFVAEIGVEKLLSHPDLIDVVDTVATQAVRWAHQCQCMLCVNYCAKFSIHFCVLLSVCTYCVFYVCVMVSR